MLSNKFLSSVAIGTLAVLGALAATPAAADGRGNGNGNGRAVGNGRYATQTNYVYARVVDVEPIVRYVTVDRPQRECWDEVVRQPENPFGIAGPTVAGTILGAAVGRQFGGDDERDALTVIGAIAGGAIANKRATRNQPYRESLVERCEVVSRRQTEEVVDGYRVTYEYQGQRYLITTDRHPGDRVQLAVDVRPVGLSGVRTTSARTRY